MPTAFSSATRKRSAACFPQAKIRQLPLDHEIYRRFFAMKATPHSYMDSIFDPKWQRHGLYGVFEGGRMIALISLCGLHAGGPAPQHPDNGLECMKMTVNIYIYAMTR